MISIKTDLKDTRWLRYVVEQFRSINLAHFEIEIVDTDTKEKFPNVIWYTSAYRKNALNIFRSNEVMPNGEIAYLKEDMYILKKTSTEDDRFALNYDIFWNAFVFLSRYEEYLSEKNGKNIYSYSLNHPRIDKSSFDIPIVNILFNELEIFFRQRFHNLHFGKPKKPKVDLSHDVDYIKKTVQLRLKQTLFNGFNTLKSIKHPHKFVKNAKKTILFLFSNPSYWCFDYWKQTEQRKNLRSTFYVYVKEGRKNFIAWLLDPSYDITTDMRLRNELKALYRNGFDIGLHGSYESAKDIEKLKREKDILERTLGICVTKTRQHWLNYYESITPKAHERLFAYDSTLGWNDRAGFRSGCASAYNPYNFEKKEAYKHVEVPQVVMDAHLFDYANNENKLHKIVAMIQKTKKTCKTMHISVSWHQRVCSDDYKWHVLYEELVDAL